CEAASLGKYAADKANAREKSKENKTEIRMFRPHSLANLHMKKPHSQAAVRGEGPSDAAFGARHCNPNNRADGHLHTALLGPWQVARLSSDASSPDASHLASGK